METADRRKGRLRAYVQLMRPPNVVTAGADVLAGYAASGRPVDPALLCLFLATTCLYAGGVVLNDVFDAPLDAVERPERPLPSGRASVRGAAALGAVLLTAGIGAAFLISLTSGVLAALIAACAVLYDAWGKHRPVFGPINMGTCRGLNLLLGVSAVPALVAERWYLALIPVAYIAAITAISRGEVHGGTRRTGLLALILLGLVLIALPLLALTPGFLLLPLAPFLAFFAWRVVPPFWRAYREPSPDRLRTAVKAGVLSLIVLDAALAAGYAGPLYGIVVLSLLLVAGALARRFMVT
uniref:Aromatic prenyltransferase 1, UbiA family n=1 Tax=uncultured Armatimonadetes bacterium TaxID=157466 RepID=A0A6J4JY04_9BACT|nr:Aromatic prenyltransferase 1, UbiA family [uncultured Armatimonadetes bacterium]